MPIPFWLLIQAPTVGPDPTPFLSAIAATSATMVAIVGGLLVARYVAIASEQEGTDRLLSDVRARLARAVIKAQGARDLLRDWSVIEFFGAKVIHAIGEGEQDIHALRKIGDPTLLTDDELTKVVQEVTAAFAEAGSTLPRLLADSTGDGYIEWEDFKHAHRAVLPEVQPDRTWQNLAWQDAYETALLGTEPAEPQPPQPDWSASFVRPFLRALPVEPAYVVRGLERRDSLQLDLARADQQVEDIKYEFLRLTNERKRIVRPQGLGWGLAVLGYFTLAGVISPLWLMSRGPNRLTAHLGEIVFWTFASGLALLLVYMTALALRLTHGRRIPQPDDQQPGTDDSKVPLAR